MKIAILSDLHLEHGNEVDFSGIDADVLVLAGDCIVAAVIDNPRWSAQQELFEDVFASASSNFEHVLYIMGNHEYYHSDFATVEPRVREWLKQWPNVQMLEQQHTSINGVRFVGATLWSDTSRDPYAALNTSLLGDFQVIRDGASNLRLVSYQFQHERAFEYLQHACSGVEPTVVITHHSPSERSTAPRFEGTALNTFFHSKLDDWIENKENIKLWIHGHMHNPSDYTIGSTRVVCNPVGYPGEPGTATTIKIVEV